jgi:uncharacterized FAD-dependent dehydrogenase
MKEALSMGNYDVIIIGAGPAGIFCAIRLVRQNPGIKVLMLEKGQDIMERSCPSRINKKPCYSCTTCGVTSGWGGAGAFSDGKLALSTEVGGILGNYLDQVDFEAGIRAVHDIYLEFGAPKKVFGLENQEEILNLQHRSALAGLRLVPAPVRHMGTGRTQKILYKMQEYLLAQGVEVRVKCPVESITVEDGDVAGVVTTKGERISARYVICAPGRLGAQWLEKQAGALKLQTAVNPVDIGVRVELPAVVMEPLTKLTYEAKFLFTSPTFEDRVRTFCMNPCGEVVMENTDGLITVNGHTHAELRTENTNFALLVSKNFTEPFKQPIAYGRYVASLANMLSGGVIVQRLGDLMHGRRSTAERIAKGLVVPTLKEAVPGDLSMVLPYRHFLAIIEMLKAMDQVSPGVYSRHTLIYGVEVKFYSSRLQVSNVLETTIGNLFMAGDGAGITRGLAQASLSGMVVAREIGCRLTVAS